MSKPLNAKQLRAAAAASRELAMECVSGTAPALESGSWCGCAIADVLKRVRLFSEETTTDLVRSIDRAKAVDRLAPDRPGEDLGLVSNALIEAGYYFLRPEDAVVFPLLHLADELEIAARKSRP